jgi:uncharacterized membrane protein YgcG
MSWLHLGRSPRPIVPDRVDPIDPAFLEAARAASTPEPERLERVRSTVMAEFRAAGIGRAAAEQKSDARWRGWSPAWRVAPALGLSIVLALGSLGLVAAASAPGRPLYELRLAFETVTLPASGSSDRLAAQLDRLDRRLSEAETASADGDPGAASDAIAAYRAELDDTSVGMGAASADTSGLSTALAQHAILLARLGSELTGTARDATAQALSQIDRLQSKLQPTPGHTPPGAGNEGNPGNGNGGGNPGNGGGGGGGGGGGNGNGGGGGHGNGGGNPGNGGGNGGGNPGNGGGDGPGGAPAH